MRAFYAILALGLASTPAFAVGTAIPEPGTIGLVGVGVAAIVYLSKRRK